MNLQQQLKDITLLPELHGQFLYELSALERSGHQKLLKFKQRWNVQEEDFQEHLKDEARHAHHLRTLSEKFAGERKSPGPVTRNYLTKLEVFILRELRKEKNPSFRSCYVLLTYIIEKRAETFYPAYEALLESALSVSSIIEDEGRHLELMREEIDSLNLSSGLLERAMRYEEELFADYMAQFSASLTEVP